MSPTARSTKFYLIYGLNEQNCRFEDFHHLNLLLVHVSHVWMVATLKVGGQPASKVGKMGRQMTPPTPYTN